MNQKSPLNQSGYNLLEVMVVVVILGALAMLSLTKLTNSSERMRASEGIQALKTLRAAQEAYKQERGSYTAVMTSLAISMPSMQFFDTPVVSDSDVNALVSIGRKSSNFTLGTAYTLRISQTGTVTCTVSSYCTQLGF